MFHQLLTPVGDSLGLSFLVAVLPVLAVLLLLGVLRRPAWQAALAGLIVGLIIAVFPWRMPIGLALHATLCGATFALWPVMWIVINALLLYNIAVRSGRFDAFRTWVVTHLPNDRRVVLVVIGFCFGALLEGIAGFGTPVAITSSLLILVGYPALEALVFVPQYVADPDNRAPRSIGVFGQEVLGQRLRGFRYDLHGAFHRAAMHIAALVMRERKAANNHGDALDLISNMKQTGAGAQAGGHQKIRTASRSTSPTMSGDKPVRVE